MDRVDIVIVGAGIVGLAIAERISSGNRDVVVIEKNDSFGREASSRNSEVIHAGIYYPKDTLKARLCVEGNRELYSLCREQNIAFRKTGKIIVATTDEEVAGLAGLLEQGKANGVAGLEMLSKEEVTRREPRVRCRAGLFSPESGIIDSHGLMACLEAGASSRGALFAYGSVVEGFHLDGDSFVLEIGDSDGERTMLRTSWLINAAGLDSDRIAEMAGIEVDEAGYRLHPCKGEYFRVSHRHRRAISHLIYPVPTAISLGVHVVLCLDGSLKLGPNAFYVDRLSYEVEPSHQQDFFQRARRFLPFLDYQDLSPDMAGIRAKLQEEGEAFRDFVIREESGRGIPGLINLIGIESPGLTSCLSIAREVGQMIG
jgi:L-2-hydroxyglutarate oxidase LhgO